MDPGYGLFQLIGSFQQAEVNPLEFLNVQNIDYPAIYDVAVALLFLVIPTALTWYAKNYVKSAEHQKRINMIASLASQAICYSEDLERQGVRELAYNSLDLPDSLARNPSPGHQKLCLASSWLVEELARLGIKSVDIEDATKWVAAEFQKQVGDMRTIHSVSALADMAAGLLSQLGRDGHITLPNNTLETVSLIQSVSDWVASQSIDDMGNKTLPRDMAMARIAPRSLMMAAANGRNSSRISPEVRLTLLANKQLSSPQNCKNRAS